MAQDTDVVARWDFGTEESAPLTAHGGVKRDQAGPKPPEFPDFAENNTAVQLDGNGAYLSVRDSGPSSRFDFTNGDAITLEAWVRLDGHQEGRLMYVVGKGRTGAPRFARDNQNWALRIFSASKVAKLSFLFATAPGSGNQHWHRWTSQAGFEAETGWHHIAVAYRFGEPDSIRGWIDGQKTDGIWDMGGATDRPPVVDDDAVWIGSSRGGSPSNSFRGWIDSVAIHRGILGEKQMAAKFRRAGGPQVIKPQPEVMPDLGEIPNGRVLVTFSEALSTHERWPNVGEIWPEETTRLLGDEFLLPRIPLRYDDWGIRASWQAPLLLRIAADVDLPRGSQRFLLRARGLSRLWVDGEVVARTEAITERPPDGEEPITPLAKPPLSGLRVHGYHQQEALGEITIEKQTSAESHRSRVVLEVVVGGKDQRTETGELCVAVQTQDGTSYEILRPSKQENLPLTDAAIGRALARIEASLSRYDDRNRRRASATQEEFWYRRHEAAREWAAQHPAPEIPKSFDQAPLHPIDAFIQAKIDDAVLQRSQSDTEQTAEFHNHVLPVLRENCFRCHGEKEQGGLLLNSREAALLGGESETPAVVPGNSAASELIARVSSDDESLRMPPTGNGLSFADIATLTSWIDSGAHWPPPPIAADEIAIGPAIGDAAFLRRVYLDTVGVPPTSAEVREFLKDTSSRKRATLIERLLDDERYADHWISFWLDLLAENPTLINQSLNSTGPFRWFLYDALRDNKPLDRLVTELVLMRGSPYEGGSAGFELAGENDAPLAAKGHIVASAFLGIELQCARCHDSPYHSTTQRDLYPLAAMLGRKSMTVPDTSRVPDAFFEKKSRESLIRVTLKPSEPVAAMWPFADATGIEDGDDLDRLMHNPDDSRERLAALITAPENRRFPRVIVNRLWQRLIGAGFVEPVHDWEGKQASHPKLLDWLAHQLITRDYDHKHVMRLILTSETYQREATGHNRDVAAERRFFNAPDRRRLTAEQIVDSLHAATGCSIDSEELTFVHDGRREFGKRLSLGNPQRAWMFASLNNERDRPSLSLPRARAVTDVLQAFGWTGSRQKPITERDGEPNLLQPGVLANGVLTNSLTRAGYGTELARLAVEAKSSQRLVDELFLRFLSRRPKPDERKAFSRALARGFDTRLVPNNEVTPPDELPELPLVTWFNHLRPDATKIQQEIERRVRRGPAPDTRLRRQWRETYEDVVWSLVNHREFVWIP